MQGALASLGSGSLLHHVWPLRLRGFTDVFFSFLRTLTQAFLLEFPSTPVRQEGLIVSVDFRIVLWKVHWFCELGDGALLLALVQVNCF